MVYFDGTSVAPDVNAPLWPRHDKKPT